MSGEQGKFLPVLLAGCTMFMAGAALVFMMLSPGRGSLLTRRAGQADAELYRALANKLKSIGLAQEAVFQYEQYFSTAELDTRTRANLAYTIGTLCLEEGSYAKALSWLYRVDLIDPDTPLKSETGLKIVHCLESLGKTHAAEYALASRSDQRGDPEGELKGSNTVAEVAGKKISLRELDEELESLPPWLRDQFKGKEKKLEFLKKFVADELFYRKAQKLELDKNSTLRKEADRFMKQLMVNKILEQEVKDKVSVAEDDLKTYYKANQERYQEKAQARIRVINGGTEERTRNIMNDLKHGKDFAQAARELSLDKATAVKGGQREGWVTEGSNDLGIGSVQEVSKAIFSTDAGGVSPPVRSGSDYYLFKVEEKKPGRTRGYEEVKELVRNDYMNAKMTSVYQQLVEQMLGSTEVKLYPEVITEEESAHP